LSVGVNFTNIQFYCFAVYHWITKWQVFV